MGRRVDQRGALLIDHLNVFLKLPLVLINFLLYALLSFSVARPLESQTEEDLLDLGKKLLSSELDGLCRLRVVVFPALGDQFLDFALI